MCIWMPWISEMTMTCCRSCLILAIIPVVLSVETKDTICDRDAVLNCVTSFNGYENLTEAVFPRLTESTLKAVCREYEGVDKCLSPMRDNCTSYEEYYYLGLDGTFKFVCDEQNMAVYLKHAACFGNTDLQRKGRKCLTDFYLRFYIYFTRDNACSFIGTYLRCTRSAVKSICGSEAAEWQYQVNRRYIAAMIKEFHCKLGVSHQSTGVHVAIGLVVTLTITSTLAIIIWLCRRRIIDQVAKVRARHLQNYSTQRNEEVPQNVQSITGQNQGSSRYVVNNTVMSQDDINHVTGIANQSYTEDGHATNTDTNTNGSSNNDDRRSERFI